MVEHSLQGLGVLQDGRIIFANPALAATFGQTAEELTSLEPEQVVALVHPEDRGLVAGRLRDRLAGQPAPSQYQFRILRKDGTVRWLEVLATLIELQERPAVQAAFLDITKRKQAEEALYQSETRFRRLIEKSADGIALVSADAAILSFPNPATQLILGYDNFELVGRNFFELLHPDDLDKTRTLFAQIQQKPGQSVASQFRFRHKDGSWRWVEGSGINLLAEPCVQAIVANYRDITERKGMEQALQESERQQRLVLDQIDEIVYRVQITQRDPFGGKVLYVSSRVKNLIGYEANEFVADPQLWFKSLHPDDLPAVSESTQRILALRQAGIRTYRMRHKETGEYRWMEDRVVPQLDNGGHVIGLFGVARDVTGNKEAEAKLQRSADALHALSCRLLEVQEAERRQLALELHDHIGQTLTMLKLNLDLCQRLPPDSVPLKLAQAQTMVDELLAVVRNLSLDLRPSMLDDLGLLHALLWHLDRYTHQTQVRVTFQHDGLEERRFAPALETAAFRIAQQALTNVARHAGVREVRVRVWADQEVLQLQVQDDGRGFDPGAAQAAGASSGLYGMRERALLLGGRLIINSVPGAGTCVIAEFPLGGQREEGV